MAIHNDCDICKDSSINEKNEVSTADNGDNNNHDENERGTFKDDQDDHYFKKYNKNSGFYANQTNDGDYENVNSVNDDDDDHDDDYILEAAATSTMIMTMVQQLLRKLQQH